MTVAIAVTRRYSLIWLYYCKGLQQDVPTPASTSIGKSFITLLHALSKVGRPEAALTAAHEAVELFRRLTGNPCVPESHLIISLLRFSDCQSSLGREEEAVDTAVEAIRIKAGLIEGHTGWDVDNHAEALTNFARRFREVGRHDEALEAVDLCRTLAASRPALFTQVLATSLLYLGADFREVGCRNEALDARSEAVKLYRTLADDLPAVFT